MQIDIAPRPQEDFSKGLTQPHWLSTTEWIAKASRIDERGWKTKNFLKIIIDVFPTLFKSSREMQRQLSLSLTEMKFRETN